MSLPAVISWPVRAQILLVTCLLLQFSTVGASPVRPGPGILRSGLDRSEQLLAELHCTSCHRAPASLETRLISARAPDLAGVGSRLTADHLRRFLLDPSATKPGTAMPDLLAGRTLAAREAAAEDLVHYLASLRVSPEPPAVETDPLHLQTGEELFHSVGCVACHPAERAASDGLEKAAGGVPLTDLPSRMRVEHLTRFLLDPQVVRPSGRMPKLGLSRSEAESIAQYLLREQAEGEGRQMVIEGLKTSYYEFPGGGLQSVLQLLEMTPKARFTTRGFAIEKRERNDFFGFVFRGRLRVEQAGKYRFFTNSDDGSLLWIGDQIVVNNDGVHGGVERTGEIELTVGDHPIQVGYFENAGGEHLRVAWQPPGGKKGEIPVESLLHVGLVMRPPGDEPLAIDATRRERGRELFESLGCASCHSRGDLPRAEQPPTKVPALAALSGRRREGCLDEKATPGVPRYSLSGDQRNTLFRILGKLPRGPLEPEEKVRRRLAVLNCIQCHERDGRGGPEASRLPYFHPTVEADLGDEGRIPPTLTGVGDKLRLPWMEQVLRGEGVARPYMATRMPAFGEEILEGLPELLVRVDREGPGRPETTTEALFRDGRRLVGNQGMSCVTCHSYGQYPSLGIPALDLSTMTRRLRKDWFFRYVKNPQAFRPDTRMPAFFSDGESALDSVLDGDVEKQIEAMWTYLARGESVRIPAGLTRKGQVLVPEEEALIYRHFVQGAGPRAIAVGYPEELNLAWDSADLRPALLWRGAFIDAQKHRSGRGAGYQGPAGKDVLSLPAVVPLARLESPESPWPTTGAREPGSDLRFRGYRLNARREPTFLYSLGKVEVAEHYHPVVHDGTRSFRRSVEILNPGSERGVYFLLARGSLERVRPGCFRLDDRLSLGLESPVASSAILRQGDGSGELLVPVAPSGKTQIDVILEW